MKHYAYCGVCRTFADKPHHDPQALADLIACSYPLWSLSKTPLWSKVLSKVPDNKAEREFLEFLVQHLPCNNFVVVSEFCSLGDPVSEHVFPPIRIKNERPIDHR